MTVLLPLTFAASLGLAFSAAAYGSLRLVAERADEGKLRQRLRLENIQVKQKATAKDRVKGLLARGGERFARPFVKDKDGGGNGLDALRKQLVRAGIYAPLAANYVVCGRMALLLVGLVVGWALAGPTGYDPFLTVAAGGGIGYLLPKFWLSRRIKANQKLLERALPDGLDLLVVCVEAGLTLDSAMQRVSEELNLAHPALSRELSICHMETQIGLPRADALKNLGERSGLVALQALTAMLVQADRFGTSVAGALRIQSDALRAQRKFRAEEASAKATVKLSFPLVLFIFPASFLIMAGPMVINVMKNGMFGGE